jgi:hypothetical protein
MNIKRGFLVLLVLAILATGYGALLIRRGFSAGAIELCILIDLAREEARAKRAERNEADSECLDCRQNLRLRTSPK